MSKDLILLTGATGFVGFRTLITALEAGYRVRAIVRKSEHINKIKSHKATQPHLTDIEFAVVPDLGVKDAFASVFDSVKYVLHIASPLPQSHGPDSDSDIDAELIQPAVKTTLNVLEQAEKTSSVKRVVITSSIVAVVPFKYMTSEDSIVVYDAESKLDVPKSSNSWEGYAASKVAAYNASWKWMEEQKPQFDLINILPGPIVGAGDWFASQEDIAGSMNKAIIAVLTGTDGIGPFAANTVHVQDVANLHVWSLKPEIKGNQNFLAASGGLHGAEWDDANYIARAYFPEKVGDGTFKLHGNQPTRKLKVDAYKTEKTFGFTFKPFKEQVRDVAEQYIKLSA